MAIGLMRRIRASREAVILAGMLIFGTAVRATALPASLWEWDEVGFARGMRDFDLAAHSPHPPGFPVFIALAKLLRMLLADDQTALIGVNLLFSSFLGVVLYLLYREFGLDRSTAIVGAVLCCLAPAIVVWSNAGRSDSPALVTGLTVIWLALRGRRSERALLGAALLCGLGAGIRVTIVPFAGIVLSLVLLNRLYQRHWRAVIGSLLLVAGGVLLWYLPLVQATGWNEYQQILRTQSAFIAAHDTIWSGQWTLAERLSAFLVRVWGEWRIAVVVNISAALGVVALIRVRHPSAPAEPARCQSALFWISASFVPLLVFTILVNSPTAAIVYSLPYIPFFTGLAATGIIGTLRLLFRASRQAPRPFATVAGAGLAMVLAIVFILWSLPAARLLRREVSPPARAAEYLRRRFDPAQDKLYYDELLTQHAIYYFRAAGRSEIEQFLPDEELSLNLIYPENRDFRRIYLLSTAPIPGLINQRFGWSAGTGLERLKPLSFGRYLEVYLSEPGQARNVVWSSGWFEAESLGPQSWRWMGKAGRVGLFNEADRMRLRIRGRLPAPEGRLSVRVDGREVGVLAEQEVDFSLPVEVKPGASWSMLTLESDRTYIPKQNGEGSDERELGFQCFSIGWEMAEGGVRRRNDPATFLREGWGALRIGQPRSWRTTAGTARVTLPPLPAATGRLRMVFRAPHPDTSIDVTIGDRRLETLSPPAALILTRSWMIDTNACPERRCLLTLQSASAGSDVALEVTSISWRPE